MLKKEPHSKPHKRIFLTVSILLLILQACSFNSSTPPATGPASVPTSPDTATSTPSGPAVPPGWKAITDPSGSCRVSTPPDWQIGTDFFLESGSSFPPPFEGMPGNFPPRGKALWPEAAAAQPPQGWRFQQRTSIVDGGHVCSVYRIKPDVDFTDEETNLMKQVGSTLQEEQASSGFLFANTLIAVSRLLSSSRFEGGFVPDWDIHVQDYSGQGDGGDESSSSSDQNSSDGQSIHDRTSHKGNEDGSSEDEENTTASNGTNFKGNTRTTTKTDSRGNRTVHHEEIIKENGSCTKLITDTIYDRNNKVVGTPKVTKIDISCPVYTLKIDFSGKGNAGGLDVKYGPNSEWVWLEYESGTHKGQFSGNWDIEVTGECEGFGQFPVTFDINATEDQFEKLSFKIRASLGYRMPSLCRREIGASIPPVASNLTFELPGEVGASAVVGDQVKITFTLLRGGE